MAKNSCWLTELAYQESSHDHRNVTTCMKGRTSYSNFTHQTLYFSMVLDIERGINTAKRENQEDICSAQEHLQILTASQFSYS